jgi:hypothetical protein
MKEETASILFEMIKRKTGNREQVVIYVTSFSRENNAHKIPLNILQTIKIICWTVFLSKPSCYSAELCIKSNTVVDKAGIKLKIADI